MFPDDPATDIERLAKLRALIADLKSEEESARQRLLTLRDGLNGHGGGPRLRIETKRQRHLGRAALPDHVRSDPRSWTRREVRVLRLLEGPRNVPHSIDFTGRSDHDAPCKGCLVRSG
ncbi:MAG: hypothetical protein AAF376_14585 [Pseudomonadota bacterium]